MIGGNMRADMESAPTLKLFLFDWDGGNLRTSTARPYGVVVLSLWLDAGGWYPPLRC